LTIDTSANGIGKMFLTQRRGDAKKDRPETGVRGPEDRNSLDRIYRIGSHFKWQRENGKLDFGISGNLFYRDGPRWAGLLRSRIYRIFSLTNDY
jgi:hypothetical protein